jgi:predicted enzyme related to lactoylglutathione lyase
MSPREAAAPVLAARGTGNFRCGRPGAPQRCHHCNEGATIMLKELEDFPGLKTENGIASTPVGKAAWFTDSEGNILHLFQRQ